MNPIPIDAMKRLLLGAESTAHRGGWDQPPLLAVLDQIRPGTIALTGLPIGIEGEPGLLVEQAGYLFARDDHGAKLILARSPGFVGMAFIYEGWQPQLMTREERKKENRKFADIPGSVEVRMISVNDIWGRSFALHRVRGQKPEILQSGGEVQLGGRVHNGLAMMTLAVARLLPNADELVPILEAQVAAIHKVHAEDQ